MLGMSITKEEPARRVAEAIRTRRAELGLSQQEVVARVRDSDETTLSLNNFRAYEWGARPNPSAAVMAAISRALGWEPDALSKIFTGSDEPITEAPAATDRSIAARLARLEAQMGGGGAKLTDYDAMKVLLNCLNDEQFRVVALAVNADERFRAAIT